MIYITAIGLPPGGSRTVRIYTQRVHRTTQNKQYIEKVITETRFTKHLMYLRPNKEVLNFFTVSNFFFPHCSWSHEPSK